MGWAVSISSSTFVPRLWQNEVLVPLPLAVGSVGGYVYGINDAGLAVGASIFGTGQQATLWRIGAGPIVLDLPTGAVVSDLSDVNSGGDAIGQATFASGESHGIRYSNGVLTDLGVLNGMTLTYLSRINRSGRAVGSCLNDPVGQTSAPW